MREEELYYIHDKEICRNELGCKCNNLHPINIDHNTGITIIGINWIRGDKKAFVTILPTKMWEQFRRDPSSRELAESFATGANWDFIVILLAALPETQNEKMYLSGL